MKLKQSRLQILQSIFIFCAVASIIGVIYLISGKGLRFYHRSNGEIYAELYKMGVLGFSIISVAFIISIVWIEIHKSK